MKQQLTWIMAFVSAGLIAIMGIQFGPALVGAITDATQQTIEDSIPPSIPSGLAAAGVTQSTVSLVWSASSDDTGVAGYRLYERLRINPYYSQWVRRVDNISATSAEVLGLTPGALYTYAVTALDGAGNESEHSSVVTVQTLRPPTAYQATSEGVGGVYAVSGVLFSYNVDALGVPAPTFSRVAGPVGMSVDPLSGLVQWLPTDGDVGPTTVSVRASNSEGDNDHTFEFAVYPAGTDLERPSSVWYPTARDITANGAILSWSSATDNVGIVGYYIMAQKDGHGQGLFIAGDSVGTETLFTITTLQPSTGYRLWVAAYDAGRNVASVSGIPGVHIVTLPSPDIPAPTDTEPPGLVSSLTATDVGSTSFTLMWTPAHDNVGVEGYHLLAQKDGVAQGMFLIGSVLEPETTYTVTEVAAGTGYQVWVAAFDQSGNVASTSQQPPLYVITLAATDLPAPLPTEPVTDTVTATPTATVTGTVTATETVTPTATTDPVETPVPTATEESTPDETPEDYGSSPMIPYSNWIYLPSVDR